MTSAYITSQRKEAERLAAWERNIREVNEKCRELSSNSLPPVEMMNIIGSHDEVHFKNNMLVFFNEFYSRGCVDESSVVLDIGSGCGRIAIPFTFLIDSGEYFGVDVWPEGISWCKEKISSIYPNFKFFLQETANNYYYEDRDASKVNQFNLEFCNDSSVDFAFAISLFTHLTKGDCASYLREIGRVMKPTGTAFITCFIIDKYFRNYVQATGNHTAVKEEEPGCYYAYSGQDFFGGYSLEKWEEMLSSAGLEVISREAGSWARKPGARPFQDTFIIGKRS